MKAVAYEIITLMLEARGHRYQALQVKSLTLLLDNLVFQNKRQMTGYKKSRKYSVGLLITYSWPLKYVLDIFLTSNKPFMGSTIYTLTWTMEGAGSPLQS